MQIELRSRPFSAVAAPETSVLGIPKYNFQEKIPSLARCVWFKLPRWNYFSPPPLRWLSRVLIKFRAQVDLSLCSLLHDSRIGQMRRGPAVTFFRGSFTLSRWSALSTLLSDRVVQKYCIIDRSLHTQLGLWAREVHAFFRVNTAAKDFQAFFSMTQVFAFRYL